MRIIDISNFKSELIILERAYYEEKVKRGILNFIVLNNLKDQYEEYYEDYLIYLKVYEDVKDDFNKIILSIEPNFSGEWKVNFKTKEVYLYDKL